MNRSILGTLSLLLLVLAGTAGEPTAAEKQKIERLIQHVESLKNAVFVRNGKAYDAPTAARFLRGKWKASADEVKTARDFIEKIATASSTTGRPYHIRFKDGTEQKSGEYLRSVLKKLSKQ
jgi:hypothetical protein